ncbi:hypothetical protein RJ639_027702 [Escallonia herrerae]|uniref:Epidermal patterning factor-like protein n=1 Tax=Escallonia herrerae TaxID=1293975 RepID=A0AA88X445_9ASTE|nr:hypothetical protein RJ639_027702 [Escallonia herrerae]
MPNRKEVEVARSDPFEERKPKKHRRPDTLQIAGSSLPDCSHACGSCSPCRLVMRNEVVNVVHAGVTYILSFDPEKLISRFPPHFGPSNG